MRTLKSVRGVALLAAVFTIFGVLPAGAAEEEGVKNLSEPLVFAEAEGATHFTFYDLEPGEIVGDKTYDLGGTMYYVVSNPLVQFAAEHAVATGTVPVIADWGDNLTNHSFRGNLKQPIRVEIAFWASDGRLMAGYEPVLLEGARGTEVYGITGAVTNRTPLVYTTGENLKIESLNAEGQVTGVIYTGPMTAEVNAAGKVIYGFNWGTPGGLASPDKGAYRLTVTVPTTLQITGVGAAEIFVPTYTAQTTTLDLIIGNAPGKKPGDTGGGIGPPPDKGGGGGGGQGPGGPGGGAGLRGTR